MSRRIITQGEAFSIAFFHVKIPIEGTSDWRIRNSDRLTFTIARRNRSPDIEKTFPDGIERSGDSFFVFPNATDDRYRRQRERCVHACR